MKQPRVPNSRTITTKKERKEAIDFILFSRPIRLIKQIPIPGPRVSWIWKKSTYNANINLQSCIWVLKASPYLWKASKNSYDFVQHLSFFAYHPLSSFFSPLFLPFYLSPLKLHKLSWHAKLHTTLYTSLSNNWWLKLTKHFKDGFLIQGD